MNTPPPTQLPPSVPPADAESTQTQSLVTEALAFLLHVDDSSDTIRGKMDTAKPLADIAGAILSTDEILLWQADRAGRNKWRKMADSVMTIAASLGIRIRSADKSQLSHVVEIISTIPARKAYDPSSDLA